MENQANQQKKLYEVFNKLSDKYHFDSVFPDDHNDNGVEFEDDGFLHFIRDGFDICFYNGQGKGCLTKRNLTRWSRLVNDTLAKNA